MRLITALGALILGLAAATAPAAARDQFVLDNAHIFSPGAVAVANQKISDFSAQTRKEVVVYTTPALDGATAQAAAERVMAQEQVNGVLIFISKSPKKIGVVPDRAASAFFPPGSTSAIRNAIVASFNSGDYDAGLQSAVDLSLSMYRSHLRTAPRARNAPVPVTGSSPVATQGGFGMGWIFLILILVVGFLIVRAIFRALFAPRMPMGGPMAGPPMGGPGYGPGYGQPGYGGGMMGGGGGSFWSGLLGGLGGAWLGNEMFGQHGGGSIGSAGMGGTDPGAAADGSGWQSDAGQADMGNASFGDYGSGSGAGGGWGDAGGGGGDFGGGGGDGGGGW